MTSRLDRDKAREVLSVPMRDNLAAIPSVIDMLAECVVPDRRIAALSALCNTEAGLYGYLRTEDIRNILRGGS